MDHAAGAACARCLVLLPPDFPLEYILSFCIPHLHPSLTQVTMTIAELKEKNITELSRIARTLEIPGASGLRKQDLIFKILQAQSEKESRLHGRQYATGVPGGKLHRRRHTSVLSCDD